MHPWRAGIWAALLGTVCVSTALRLGPYWAGYRKVWGDQDDWVHLRMAETLRREGPVGMLRAFYRKELCQPRADKHPWPPLLHVAAAQGSFLLGMEWSVRLTPVVAWVLASVWLYRLARGWSLPPADAAFAVALAGFSLELVRMNGVHFMPQALSGLLAVGMLHSSFRLTRLGSFQVLPMAATAGWTAATIVGYGPNLYHIGGVILISLGFEKVYRRQPVLPVLTAMGAGFAATVPYLLTASYRPRELAELFAARLLGPGSDAFKYPVLLGPPAVALAVGAVPALREAWRAREPWAIWLSTWILLVLVQCFVWVFRYPHPPQRLLPLLAPAVALAAAVGLRRLIHRAGVSSSWCKGVRISIAVLTAVSTAALLAFVEIPRRRIPDGEVAMYRWAAGLPQDAAVYARRNGIFWYYCGSREKVVALELLEGPGELASAAPGGGYWLIPARELRGDPAWRAVYQDVLRRGNMVFQREGNHILFSPSGYNYSPTGP